MSQTDSKQVEEQKQRIAKIFDDGAPTYGQIGPRFFSHYGQRLVEIAEIPSGSRVLDIATGRGAVLFPAAEAVGAEGKVIGLDLAEKMVLETNKEIKQRGLSHNVELHQMDAEDLQFPGENFDYVFCGFGIFFFPQLYQALGEFQRVLKPGGQLRASTFDKSFYDEWTWLYKIVDKYLPPDPEEKKEQDSDPEPEPDFRTQEGLQEIMKTAGFKKIMVFTETTEFIYATEEEFWGSIYSHGFRGAINRIEKEHGPEGIKRFKKDVFDKMGSLMQDDGLHQVIPAHICTAAKAS